MTARSISGGGPARTVLAAARVLALALSAACASGPSRPYMPAPEYEEPTPPTSAQAPATPSPTAAPTEAPAAPGGPPRR
jgi:hypothetical protein